ncbi:hypothetical protein FRC19_005535 [Serendipita sp. 401]|nr:hypothetical protein FRC19_005535 [Serendipita sp. 401]
MPPRPPPRGGARGGPPRGASPSRGGPQRGGAPPPQSGAARGAPAQAGAGQQHAIADHVQTIGVKKPGYGREGRNFQVFTNHFGAQITDNIISHYDGKIRLKGFDISINRSSMVSSSKLSMIINE